MTTGVLIWLLCGVVVLLPALFFGWAVVSDGVARRKWSVPIDGHMVDRFTLYGFIFAVYSLVSLLIFFTT